MELTTCMTQLPRALYDLDERALFRLACVVLSIAPTSTDMDLRRAVRRWLVHELKALDAAQALDALGLDPAYAQMLRDADAKVRADEAGKEDACYLIS